MVIRENLRGALLLLLFFLPVFLAAQVRVACIGNSITYGHGIQDREHDTYPAQLQALLGDGYEVVNFGVSGATAQPEGNLPWTSTPQYQKAKDFLPQVCVIKLGTNDSKPQNWVGIERYLRAVEALASEFEALPSHPRIYIALPAKAFSERWNIRDSVICHEMLTPLKRLSKRHRWKVIDLYKATLKCSDMFPDGIHPNPEGAGVIAKAVSRRIRK